MRERHVFDHYQWERVPLEDLHSVDLRSAVRRATGAVEAHRVRAAAGSTGAVVEILWLSASSRAGIASAHSMFWTNAASPKAALQAWTSRAPEGTRPLRR